MSCNNTQKYFSRAAEDMWELQSTTKHLPLSFISPLSSASCVHFPFYPTSSYSFCSAPPPHLSANHFASCFSFPLFFSFTYSMTYIISPPNFCRISSPSSRLSLFPMLASFFFLPISPTTFLSLYPALPCSSLSSSLLHPLLYFSSLSCVCIPLPSDVLGVWWTQEGA